MDAAKENSRPAPSQYAGFWIRFLSVMIDLALCTPFYFGLRMAFGDLHPWRSEAAFAVLITLAYCFFFSSRWQATPGMHITRIHISDDDGNRLSFSRSLYWIITSAVGMVVCSAGILYLMSRFDLFAVRDMLMSCNEQNVAQADCFSEIESIIHVPYENFQSLLFGASGLAFFLLLIWALSVALPKDKTGFHNLLCRTRIVQGRPPQSGHETLQAVEL